MHHSKLYLPFRRVLDSVGLNQNEPNEIALTNLRSFSIADITMRPLQTIAEASSTRKPMDMLQTHQTDMGEKQYV